MWLGRCWFSIGNMGISRATHYTQTLFSSIVRVKGANDKYYREITLTLRTMSELKQITSEMMGVHEDAIAHIVRDDDVELLNDEDVGRLSNGRRLLIILGEDET